MVLIYIGLAYSYRCKGMSVVYGLIYPVKVTAHFVVHVCNYAMSMTYVCLSVTLMDCDHIV